MTIDRKEKNILWSDLHTIISRANYNGKNRIPLIKLNSYDEHPISLTFFNSHLFWMYSSNNGNYESVPRRCTIEGEKCIDTVSLPMLLHNPQIMKAYVDLTYVKNKIKNPCEINNGNCSDFCFISSKNKDERVCVCRTGYQLNSDLKSCDRITDFILYLKGNYIRAVALDSKNTDTFKDAIIPTRLTLNFNHDKQFHFDYDDQNDNFYFCVDNEIKLMNLRNESKPKYLLSVSYCGDLAFDKVSKNLYYFGDDYLWVLHNTSNIIIKKKVDLSYSLRHFYVDANKGQIFCHTSSSFFLIKTSGSYVRSLGNRDIINSDTFTFDSDENTMYFLNRNHIYTKNFSTSDGVIDSYDGFVAKSIFVQKKYIYFYNSTGIWRIDKKTKSITDVITDSTKEIIKGVNLISSTMYVDISNNECRINNGDCEHFCFSRPQKTCGCMNYYSLQSDGRCIQN